MSANTKPVSKELDITKAEWTLVHELIEEVHAKQIADDFTAVIYQWELALTIFRRYEHESFLLKDLHSKEDLLFHSMCLNGLITIGKWIQLNYEGHPTIEDRTKEQIEAATKDLENNIEEWHSDINPSKLAELKSLIFGSCVTPPNH